MASFVLQPCKIRENRLVPTKDEAVTLSWDDFCKRLAPSRSLRAKSNLRRAGTNAFIGLLRNAQTQEPCNFILQNQDRSGSIEWLLKQDPSFSNRLLEVYRVESAEWDIKLEELGSVA
jgi:hypothetical protein